jgi:AraC-like DNA-binding protein/mannose-6-phosphate isomerase-like protein (cupin superfamily)
MKEVPIIPMLKFQSQALPLKVQTLKNFTGEQDDVNGGPHSHNYYEMVWVVKGGGKLYVDMQEYTLGSNTLFYVKPDQAHHFQLLEETEGFVFSFTDSFFRMDEYDFGWTFQASLMQLFSEGRPKDITYEMEEDMKEIVLKMIKESENDYSCRVEILKRYFKIFLIYLARTADENFQSAEQSRETELVKRFMELVDKNFKEKKMVAEYAGQLLVTPNYLNRIVKKITGYAAGHHIRQRIVLEAKRMGRYSDAGMKEIAYNLGFLDSAHFSRFFKTFGGTNFSDFKRGALVPLNAGVQRA